jgi:hypothetical protein
MATGNDGELVAPGIDQQNKGPTLNEMRAAAKAALTFANAIAKLNRLGRISQKANELREECYHLERCPPADPPVLAAHTIKKRIELQKQWEQSRLSREQAWERQLARLRERFDKYSTMARNNAGLVASVQATCRKASLKLMALCDGYESRECVGWPLSVLHQLNVICREFSILWRDNEYGDRRKLRKEGFTEVNRFRDWNLISLRDAALALQNLLPYRELDFRPLAAGRAAELPLVQGDFGDEPVLQGKIKKRLTRAQYDVVKTLAEAGRIGLSKDRLEVISGHGDAVHILKRLARSDGDWQSIIRLPGKPGLRYRLAIS